MGRKLKYLSFILILSSSTTLLAQDDSVYRQVDVPAEPLKGTLGWDRYIKENLKYPQKARELNIQGEVEVQFIVNIDGTVDRPLILKGIGGSCDREAIRLVKNSPKWKSALIRDKSKNNNLRKVRSLVTIPIEFKL